MPKRAVPAWIVEFLLLGKSHSGIVQRYTQDGGVVTDVWLAFAADLEQPVRVLLSPAEGTTTADMAFELHHCLKAYRSDASLHDPFYEIGPRKTSAVAALENFVAATIYIDELLRVVMPLTRWWSEKRLGRMRYKAADDYPLVRRLAEEILYKIGDDKGVEKITKQRRSEHGVINEADRDYRVIAAAPIAALLGFIRMAFENAEFVTLTNHSQRDDASFYSGWIGRNAKNIARSANAEFQQPLVNRLNEVKAGAHDPERGSFNDIERTAPALIQRVFLDRDAGISHSDALASTKADAASRLFEVSCKNITWGIIDSGIASTHPAFLDWSAIEPRDGQAAPDPESEAVRIKHSRVCATYDFTLIERIRNFDLADPAPGSSQERAAINAVIAAIERLPGKTVSPEWRVQARECLRDIAAQLRQRLIPDWRLIEPLIRISPSDGAGLPSDHGTHVAGTLGGDWRKGDKVILKGVCPDIRLYDLRVIPSAGSDNRLRATEFAVVAATEFVQFVNREAGPSGPVIHGVNISMSIPHDVRNYGCGATPVCIACDRLVSDGVVVVAAAGNRGWNEREMGFGNFTFCSITDPGNALHVITVGSTHRSAPHTYGVSFFSSRGPTGDGRIKPDLVAPGEKIRGPVRGETYEDFDGTSMAAPFVSGAAAMLLARNRELIRNPGRVKEILCKSATDLGRERYFQGHGMLDILRALQRD